LTVLGSEEAANDVGCATGRYRYQDLADGGADPAALGQVAYRHPNSSRRDRTEAHRQSSRGRAFGNQPGHQRDYRADPKRDKRSCRDGKW